MKQHNRRLILKPNNFEKVEERGAFFFSFFEPKCSLEALNRLAYNAYIDATNHKLMKATNLGIWYVQIPSNIIVNPLGEVVTPKEHKGSKYVVVDRKYRTVSNLPKLDYKAAMRFKEIFC